MPARRDYFPTLQTRQELRHALKRADPAIFAAALEFLEDDPYTFGSGYVKEIVWQYIRRYGLSPNDIARLEHVALRYLERPMSREFKYMCLTMCRIATKAFWEAVKGKLYSPHLIVSINARCLYAYADGVETGERQRLEMKRYIRHYVRRESQHYLKLDERLLAAVYAHKNWKRKGVVHRAANPSDLPILFYAPEHDMRFATLDMRACDHDKMLAALQEILSTGTMDGHTTTPWLYAIYLLQQMDNPKAVPILIEFWRKNVAYKCEGCYQGFLKRSMLKVLKHYATPEANEVIQQYRQDDQEWMEYYAGKSNGWLLSYP